MSDGMFGVVIVSIVAIVLLGSWLLTCLSTIKSLKRSNSDYKVMCEMLSEEVKKLAAQRIPPGVWIKS